MNLESFQSTICFCNNKQRERSNYLSQLYLVLFVKASQTIRERERSQWIDIFLVLHTSTQFTSNITTNIMIYRKASRNEPLVHKYVHRNHPARDRERFDSTRCRCFLPKLAQQEQNSTWVFLMSV